MKERGSCSVGVKGSDVAWRESSKQLVVVVVVVVVFAVVLTLTHRYNAVRGHKTGSMSINTQQQG